MQIKKFLLVTLLGILAVVASAQGGTPIDTKVQGKMMPAPTSPMKAAGKMKTVYVCAKCDMASAKSGKCPMCGAKMKKAKATVAYMCPECKATSDRAAKCPQCDKTMVKTASLYTCSMCHTTSAKAGKCPKCGMAMAKQDMKMKS